MKNNTTAKNDFATEFQNFKNGASVLRAINHQLRQNILRLIHNKREMTVTQIYTEMKMDQSVTSQHLAILRRAGLVITERDGKHVVYSINHTRLEQVHQIALDLQGRNRH